MHAVMALQEEEAEAAAAPASNGTAAPVAIPVPAAAGSLPPGWFEALDTNYNHPYW